MLEVSCSADLQWVLEKLAARKKKPSTGISVPKPPAPPAPPALPLTPEQKRKDLTTKKATEVELWHQWNTNGRKKEDLNPLLKSFAPLLQKSINTFRRAEVPLASLEMKHKQFFVKAVKTWDPKKEGSLATWVTWNLRHVKRWVDQNKNFARISENINEHIGSYNAVKANLTEKLGYVPDAQTIHDHILSTNHPTLGKLSLKDIRRLEREQRRGLIQSDHDPEDIAGAPNLSSRAEEVKLLIVHELTPEERSVYEYVFGLNGKPALQPGAIAKKLKMDNSKVSKLRRSIREKMMKYAGPGDE